jgi:hypothetical protein
MLLKKVLKKLLLYCNAKKSTYELNVTCDPNNIAHKSKSKFFCRYRHHPEQKILAINKILLNSCKCFRTFKTIIYLCSAFFGFLNVSIYFNVLFNHTYLHNIECARIFFCVLMLNEILKRKKILSVI